MPTPPAAGCPTADTLLAFDRGDLPEPDMVATANHLGRCAACRDWLATASPMAKTDPLLRDIRDLAPDTAIDRAPDGTPPVPPRAIQVACR